MTLARHAGRLAALALLALAIWEVAVLVAVRDAAPTDDDWRRARDAVRSRRAPGDLVLFAPGWVDPVGRKWLGELMTIDDAARMDAARYVRLWEISIRDAAALETAGLAPVSDERFGAVRVRHFVRPAATVHWDLRDRARLREVDYAPRKCVPLAPSRAGAPPTRLDVGEVPLGRELVVHAGLADFRARRDNRAWARLRVLVDGVEVTAASIGNLSGWLRLPVAATAPGRGRVVFEATTDPGRGEPRRARLDLCLAAEARS